MRAEPQILECSGHIFSLSSSSLLPPPSSLPEVRPGRQLRSRSAAGRPLGFTELLPTSPPKEKPHTMDQEPGEKSRDTKDEFQISYVRLSIVIVWAIVVALMFRQAMLSFEHDRLGSANDGVTVPSTSWSERWEAYNDARPKALPLMLACGLACYGASPVVCVCCTIMAKPALFLPEAPAPATPNLDSSNTNSTTPV